MTSLKQRGDQWELIFEDGRVEELMIHPEVFVRVSDPSGTWDFTMGTPTRAVEEVEQLNRKPLRAVVSRDGHLSLEFEDAVSINVEAADEVEAWEIRRGDEWVMFALPGGGFSSYGTERE